MEWLKRLFGMGQPAAKPVVPSTATLKKGAGGIYEIRITGILNKATLDKIQSIGATAIDQGAKDLRVMLVLKEFTGWKRGDDWGDLSFFSEHEHHIARIAAVSELRWKEQILLFLAAGRRTGQVRFFTLTEESKAQAWLNE